MITGIQDLTAGLKIGDWTLRAELGRGGNGVVWEARSDEGASPVAIKFLRKNGKPVALRRFQDEVAVVRKLIGVPGILPILGYDLSATTGLPWFAMPLATRLEEALAGRPLTEIVAHFSGLASTLAVLHERKISHRDIKPANLLSYEGRVVLSDFGIARFPGYGEVTKVGNIVGPGPTMAPEMRRKSAPANAHPADVFSLAKSLWMILTAEPQGFDGEYSASQRQALNLAWPEEHLSPLHRVLANATAHGPADRPTALTLAAELSRWVEVTSDIGRRAPDEWLAVETDLFPCGVPASAEWTDSAAIRLVLDRIGNSRIASHVMLPGGGGLDISGANPGRWPGTIELDFGVQSPMVVCPSRLHFRRIDNERTSDFFLLETNALTPPEGYLAANDAHLVDFTELPNGRLINGSAMDRGEWSGKALAEGTRALTWCLGGSFLFVMRRSRYNAAPGTYDGRHVNLTADRLAQALTREKPAQQIPIRVNAAFEEEDRSWQANPSLRPVLQHLSASQIVRLIRKWPRYKYREDMGQEYGSGSSEMLAREYEKHDARDRVISELLTPLADDAVSELLAVMYVGRDQRNYPLSRARWERYFLTRKHNRDESLRVLAAKVDAPKYLASGLRAIGAYRLRA
jgi:serine/threonine protein kinase